MVTQKSFKQFLLGLPLAVGTMLAPSAAWAATVQLAWDAPTTNEDGSALTDLAGYEIHFGEAAGSYTRRVNAGNVTNYSLPNLDNGKRYYFAVLAYDTAGNKSAFSNEVNVLTTGTTNPTPTPTPGGGGGGGGDNPTPTPTPTPGGGGGGGGGGDGDGGGDTFPNASTIKNDFDGDGISDLGMKSKQAGEFTFSVLLSGNNSVLTLNHGKPGEIEAHGDYDGDGRTEIGTVAVVKGKYVWTAETSAGTELPFVTFGKAGQQIVAGCDFDGDRKSDHAVLAGKALKVRTSSDGATKSLKLPALLDAKQITCADVDGDVAEELVYKSIPSAAAMAKAKSAIKGKASGRAAKNQLIAIGLDKTVHLKVSIAKKASIFAADLNGDGIAEPATLSAGKMAFHVGLEDEAVEVDAATAKNFTVAQLRASDGSVRDGMLMLGKSSQVTQLNFSDLAPEAVTHSLTGSLMKAVNVGISGRAAAGKANK